MMKKVMKTLLALAMAFVCGGAWAAAIYKPIAVWDGNFADLTKGGVTLANVGESANPVVTEGGSSYLKIANDATKGVFLNWNDLVSSNLASGGFSGREVTVVVAYSDMPTPATNAKGAIFTLTSQVTTTNDANSDWLGVMANTSGQTSAMVGSNSTWTNNSENPKGSFDWSADGQNLRYLAFSYKSSSASALPTGCQLFQKNKDGTWTKVYGAWGLKGSTSDIRGCSIAGPRYVTYAGALQGLKIHKIAVFNHILSDDNLAGYRFPSDVKVLTHNKVLTSEYVATGWYVTSPDELLTYNYTGVMAGDWVTDGTPAYGYFPTKHSDGTVTVEMHGVDNQAKGVLVEMKVENGEVKIKGIKAAYWSAKNQIGNRLWQAADNSQITTGNGTFASGATGDGYGLLSLTASPSYHVLNSSYANFSQAGYNNYTFKFNLPATPSYANGTVVRVKRVGVACEGANNDLPAKLRINGVVSSSRNGPEYESTLGSNSSTMVYYNFDEGVVLTVGTEASEFVYLTNADAVATSVRYRLVERIDRTYSNLSAITMFNGSSEVTNYSPICEVVAERITPRPAHTSVGFNGNCWTASTVLPDGTTNRARADTIDSGDNNTATDTASNFVAVRKSTTDKAVVISSSIRPVFKNDDAVFAGSVKKDSSWTVSMVVKPTAILDKKVSLWGICAATWRGGKGVGLVADTNGNPELIQINGTGASTSIASVSEGTGVLYDGSYHVVTVSYNVYAATRFTIYVDGVKVAEGGTAAPEIGSQMFEVGSFYGGANQVPGVAIADGTSVDDIAAWSYAMSAAEVQGIAAKFPVWPKPPVNIAISEDKKWSEIEGVEAIDAETSCVVTIASNAKLTLDTMVSCDSIEISGAGQIVADESLFTDGCYIKTLVDAQSAITIADTITLEQTMKTGFVGALYKTDMTIDLRAQNKEVISINIAGGNGGGAGGDSPNDNLVSGEGLYGLAPVPGSSWNNINRQWQDGGNQTITINGPNAYTGTETVQRGTMSLSATGKNTWQAGVDNPFLRGYLDDGNGVTVEVTGIPYTTYDVIIYATSDSSANILAPITVNGTQYTFADGATKLGNSDWGVALQATPVLGKNAIMVKGQNLQTLTISSSRTSKGRGTLCAVQVINMGGAVLTRQEFTSTIENTVNEVTLSELTDDTSSQTIVAGELNELTIHANGTAEDAELVVTVDDEFKLALLKVEGDRPVKLVTGNDFANITTLTLTTATAIRYTNDLSAGTVPNRGARTYEYANATINAFINGSNAKIHVQNGDTLNITARTAPSLEIEDGATVTIGGAVGSLWYGDGTTYVQKGGTVTSAINGTGTSGTGSGLLLGYQNTGITQMAISGGTFTIENSSINFHSCSAMTVSGTGHVKAKGVFKSNGSVTPTVTISESGIFEIGSLGWSGATLTMNGGTFKAYETSIMSAPMTISGASTIEVPEGVTLTITGSVLGTANITKTGAGNLVISGSLENYSGTVSASAGYVASSDYSKVSISGTAKLLVEETIVEYASGHFTVPTGLEAVDFDVLRPTGAVVTKAAALADTEAKISGIVTSFDVTYTNTLRAAYSNVSGFSSNSDGNNTCTYNITPYDAERATEIGAYLKHQPHLKGLDADNGFYASTDVLTFAIVGTMPTTENTIFAHFGHSNSDRYGLLLITGTKKDDVLVAYNHGSTVTPITTMSVPNASTARHVYIVTKEDDRVNDTTTFTVYLDGQKWKTLEIDHRFMIVGNVQLGGDFWGLIRYKADTNPTSPYKICDANSGGIVNCVRGYNRIISAAEIAKYSEVYHYSSPNGASERTFEATADWIDTTEGSTVWTNTPAEGEATQSGTPLAGAAIVANLTEDTTITVNVPAEGLAYESFNIKGTGSVTFEKGEDSGSIRSTGMVTIGRPVTVKPGSFDLSTPPITLLEDGDLTFDYSDFDVSEIYVTTKINLTGQIDQNDAKVHFTAPTVLLYRTAAMAYDSSIKQYVLTITPNHQNGDGVAVVDANYTSFKLLDGTAATALFPNDPIVIKNGIYEGGQWAVNLNKDPLAGRKVVVDYQPDNDPAISVKSDIKNGLNIEIVEGAKMYIENGYSVWDATISGEGTLSLGTTFYLHKTLTISSNVLTRDSGNFCLEENSVLKVPADSAVKVTAYSYHAGYVKKTTADDVDTYTFVAGTQEIAPTGDDEPVVIEDVGTGIIINPGADVEVKLPENASQEQLTTIAGKISVKYTIPGSGTVKDLKTDGLVTVSVNQETGAVELTTTEAAKPAATDIAMSTPTEGEGEEATDKVQFTITNPIPGLFYEIVSGDSFDEHGALVVDHDAEKGTSQATTSAEAKTVSIPMTFTEGKKVKYYKVSVKATK